MNGIDYDFAADTADCGSAEDFLEHFGISCERSVVHVHRLHILQRFHDYLAANATVGVTSRDEYRGWLLRAYDDFVHSDALTEKVFGVFRRAAGIAIVPISAIGRASR
ncbi:MAG: nitrogenase-stabilizing/protective protein NifW [Candidatus Nitricoxidivorans perseverans]|uniref:Nitrogenase-stabilizing/protective protein NifW n=1 Tax=Candidatus Nitricoxidivorans perseverans TaxID=2975601 RepID=A0AA49J014_9PROT|nr:MAG: nitrogenase-stabilizing/protective protein NifW [Candidatus Nitricoxidivorans perseverans]